MIHEQCQSGITLRGLRRAFCGELKTNPGLVQIVAEAAGVGQVEEVLEVAMKGHGSDLHLDCVAADGETYRIALGVHIDSITGSDTMSRDRKPYGVQDRREGLRRQVTLAPAIWFSHRGNASSAKNMVAFESLEDCASHDFWLALCQARARAETFFEEFRLRPWSQPKPRLPWWVMARRTRYY